MARLRIDLLEGFHNDTVVISAGGAEVFREQGLTTRHQIGLAETVEFDINGEATVIEIALPEKGQTQTLNLDPQKFPFLWVSLDRAGKIECQPAVEPAKCA